MKKIIAAFLFLFLTTVYSQNAVIKTDMPSAFCQAGVAFIDSTTIWTPLTMQNPSTHKFYSSLVRYNWLGVQTDSIHILSPLSSYYSVHSVFKEGNSIITTGVKSSCGTPDKYFIGSVNTLTKSYQEIKSYPALSTHEVIRGMFNAGLSRYGFYTENDVFITDFVNDTIYHVLSNVGSVSKVEYFNGNIIVGSSAGLLKLDPSTIFSPDTIFAEMVREMTIDQKQNQIYTASNFFIIRVNHTLQIQDTMHLVSSPLTISAPQEIDATNNRLYLLDGDKIFTTDSNFSFVASDFKIALRTGETHIKNFKIRNNRLLIFGVKGHYYNAKSSYPWLLGSYPLSASQPADVSVKLNSCYIDSLYKSNVNGEDFIKAKFTFSLTNNSSSLIVQRFTARFHINGTLCSGLNNQEKFNNLYFQANTLDTFSTGWLTFGSVADIHQFNSSNTRFSVFISAINKTDYTSTLDLNITTPSYGFLDIPEDIIKVNISPNPFLQNLVIEGDFSSQSSALLYNAKGQIVWSGMLKKRKTTIVLPELDSGIYFIWVNDGVKSFTGKLIRQ